MFSNLPDTKYEDGTKWEPSVLSTFSDMLAGGDPLLRTINLKANQENEKTLAYIVKETLQHKLASMHYGFINTFCIFAPTMLITFLSAAISIFSTSEIVKDADVKVWLGIAVALLQLVLSIFESVGRQLDYSARSGFHRSASTTLYRIYQEALNSNWEGRKNLYRHALGASYAKKETSGWANTTPKEGDDGNQTKDKSLDEKEKSEQEKPDSTTDVKKAEKKDEERPNNEEERKKKKEEQSYTYRIKQAVEQADSTVPIRIVNAFNIMESRILLANQSFLRNKTDPLVAWEPILIALYHQLAEIIIESWIFPLSIPSPEWAVNKALERVKEKLTAKSDAHLLQTIVSHSEEVHRFQQDVFSRMQQGRSTSSDVEAGSGVVDERSPLMI